tara:strand:- start:114 stop:650 length:537 start_codon:yes stop_codon:yes gene_type:complete
MNKALFLDRDGVINEDFGYVYKVKDIKYIDGIFDLCQKAISLDYIIIVVTNQSGIARGIFSEKDFFKFMNTLIKDFKKRKIKIHDYYYCPYHEDGSNKKYKKASFNRKPNPGMIIDAAKNNKIDLQKSIMIGDKITDVQAGIKAGIHKNILFCNESNYAEYSFKYEIIHNLRDFKKIF